MTYPQRPAQHTVLVAWGADVRNDPSTWEWYDVTAAVDWGQEYTVKDGRSENATQAETLGITPALVLANESGDYTAEDPRSPLWPHVVEGTPFWWQMDTGHGPHDLVQGFIAGLGPRWPSRSRHGAVVDVSVCGRLGIIGRGNKPLLAALRRAAAAAALSGYWPMDDGTDTAWAASGLVAGEPLRPMEGLIPTWAAVAGPAGGGGSAPQIIRDSALIGKLDAALPLTAGSYWQMECWFRCDDTRAEDRYVAPLLWDVTGASSYSRGQLNVSRNSTGDHFVAARMHQPDASWTSILHSAPVLNNGWHHLRLSATQSGSDAVFRLYLDGAEVDSVTEASATIGTPTRVQVGGQRLFTSDALYVDALWVAHVAAATVDVDLYDAGIGYAGETASERVSRLCAEEGIPVDIVAGTSEAMGAQPQATLLDLLRECERTDLGRLSEYGWGVRYRPRVALYNQAPALTIDVAEQELADPFNPKRDLTIIRNEWKVDRRGGSSATYVDNESQKRGRFDDSAQVNTYSDDVLIHHAETRVGIGTVPGYRYPGISTDLAGHPALIPAWQALRLGDRVQMVGADRIGHPPGVVDQLVDGRMQRVRGRRSWAVTMLTSPARPYTVAVIEGTGGDTSPRWRLDASASTLAASAGATDTTLSIATSSGPLLSTSAADYPCDVEIAGVRIRATAVTGASSPQTMTVQRGLDGWDKPLPAGEPVRLWQPPVIAL